MDQRTASPRSDRSPDAFGPLISAAIFGYYGFLSGTVSQTTGAQGETVALWLGTLWILRVAAVLFAVCAVLAFRADQRTDLVYGAVGVIATAGLAAILVWDQLDTNYQTAFSPLLLVIFVAWNAYASVSTLRDALR